MFEQITRQQSGSAFTSRSTPRLRYCETASHSFATSIEAYSSQSTETMTRLGLGGMSLPLGTSFMYCSLMFL